MFYKGVIEDNKDPLQAGRVRVRIFGIHSEDKKALPTENLPWASVDSPNIMGGLIQGMGMSSVLRQGLWVRVFFEEEYGVELYDKPVVMSVITGIHTTKESGIGFTDPDGVWPLSSKLGVPDMSTSARGSGVTNKNDNITPDTGEQPQGSSSYGQGLILETPGGHLLELDDTTGNKRVQLLHNTGTYIEMNAVGALIEKVVSDKLNIILANYNLFIDGNNNLKVKGNQVAEITGNDELKVTGNQTATITGNSESTISGNNNMTISGSLSQNVSGSSTEQVGGTKQISAATLMLN